MGYCWIVGWLEKVCFRSRRRRFEHPGLCGYHHAQANRCSENRGPSWRDEEMLRRVAYVIRWGHTLVSHVWPHLIAEATRRSISSSRQVVLSVLTAAIGEDECGAGSIPAYVDTISRRYLAILFFLASEYSLAAGFLVRSVIEVFHSVTAACTRREVACFRPQCRNKQSTAVGTSRSDQLKIAAGK